MPGDIACPAAGNGRLAARLPPHDLFKGGAFASGQELPMEGGITGFGQGAGLPLGG